jgi:putrescine transport system permease protein
LGELERQFRLGAGVVTDVMTNMRRAAPWDGVRRRLGGLGVSGRLLVLLAPTLWLTVFFLVPLAIVFGISLSVKEFGQPPYSDLLTFGEDGTVQLTLHLSNYLFLLSDSLYANAYLNSIKVAAISTLIALIIGYPMAYAIARAPEKWRNILLMLVILPFWTSFLLRVYAWIGFMKNNGVINNVLVSLGIINEPIVMLQTDFAVYVGIVYTYLPFMILPRRRPTSAPGRSSPSSPLPCRCHYQASSQAPCWCSFPQSASSSSRRCSGDRAR